MSRPVRVLVVDDERPARQRLTVLLRSQPDADVVGDCADGPAALRALADAARAGEPVDVLFLDVQMPEVDGFDVLEALAETLPAVPPAVVFVTAYDHYAVRAFDAHAADYLLKPYSDERFRVAFRRAAESARARTSAGASADVIARLRALVGDLERGAGAASAGPPGGGPADGGPPPRLVDRLVLKDRGRAWLLDVREIRWVGAAGVYVEIHTKAGKTHLHREVLGALERQLDPRQFVRIHRSHLVSLDAIKELHQDSHGAYTVVLHDGTQLSLSRAYRAQVQDRLGQSL